LSPNLICSAIFYSKILISDYYMYLSYGLETGNKKSHPKVAFLDQSPFN